MHQNAQHIALVTDPHIVEKGTDLGNHRTNDSTFMLAKMLSAEPSPLAGVCFLGDLCDTSRNPDRSQAIATESSYENAALIFEGLRCPRLHIPGNHDDPAILSEVHPSSWIQSTDGVSMFRIHDVDLIAIDARTGPEPTGFLREETLEALDRVLHDSRRAVLLSHFPLVDFDSDEINRELSTINRHELKPLLHRHSKKILGLMHGHLHLWSTTSNDGLTSIGLPSSSFAFNWEPHGLPAHPESVQPKGYAVLSISADGAVALRYRFLPTLT